MICSRLKFSTLVATLTLAAGSAYAADYAPPPQCYDAGLIASGRAPYGAIPCYAPPTPVVEEFSSWYLRGDIGITNQSVRDLTNIQDVANQVRNVGIGFDASPLFGIGIGYYYNDWLRFDVTGEYRSKANFKGSQIIRSGGATYTDEYSGSKSEWLFLANAYVDLGTWSGITPFVGAGVGMSRNTISSFQDVNTPNAGVAFADDASKWNFAWALHAGASYKVTKNFAVELAYRYVNLGDAQSGDIYTYNGINNVYNPMEFKHITSHDVKLGVRVNFDAFDSRSVSYAPPPVYQAPAYQPPVYQPPAYQPPPPVFVQPPLRSKG